jgi:hypothetical protein
MSRLLCLVLTIFVISTELSIRSIAQDDGDSFVAASGALLERAQKTDMLALGERHWSIPEHRFLTTLIRNPQFPSVFPEIIVEFGNAHYQKTINRYLAGKKVSDRELNKVWQDTTVPMAWDTPLYAEFFEAIRNVNSRLPRNNKIHVFLGDPPVNWSKVKTVADFKPFMDRDAFYATVMARNCSLERCLLICGALHFQWKDPLANLRPPSTHKNVLEYYRARTSSTNKIEVVLPLYSQAEPFARFSVPSLSSTYSLPLSAMRFGQVDQSRVSILKKVDGEMKAMEVQADDTLPISEVVDWVLYLGKEDKKSEPTPSLYQDRAYVRELYRRSKIVGDAFGFDLTADVKEIDPDAKPAH